MTTKTKAKIQSHTDKIASIEQSSEKNKVRAELIRQAMEWVEKYCPDFIHGATLPAENAYYENLFVHMFQTFSNKDRKITFNCADKTRSVALKALMNLPENANILNGDFSELFNKNLVRKKNNILFAKGEAKTPNMYNFVWADYCCPVRKPLVNDLISVINTNMDKGVIYVTFCGSTRKKGGRQNLLNDLGIKSDKAENKDLPQVLADHISKMVIAGSNKRVHNIYKVIYGGGTTGKTTMITLGFSVNLAKDAITVISENRQGRDAKRYATYYKMKNTKGWGEKVGKKRGRKRLRKPNAELVKAQKEKEKLNKKILIRMQREGWNATKTALDLNKVYGFNLTAGQVGAKWAHLNPNGTFAKKKAAKK